MIRDSYPKKRKGSGCSREDKESTGESDAPQTTGESDATAICTAETTGEWDAPKQKRKPTPLPAGAPKKAKTEPPQENIFQPAIATMASALTNLVMRTSPQDLETKLKHTMLKEMQKLNACLHATLQEQRAEYEADYDKDLTHHIQMGKEEGAKEVEAEIKQDYETARQLIEMNSVAKDRMIEELHNDLKKAETRIKQYEDEIVKMIEDKKRIGAPALSSDSSSQARITQLENEIAASKLRSDENLKMAKSMTGIAEGLKTRLANSEEKGREMLSHFEEAQKMLQQVLLQMTEDAKSYMRGEQCKALCSCTLLMNIKQKDSKIAELEAEMSRARNSLCAHASKITELETQMSRVRKNHAVLMKEKAELEAQMSSARVEHGVAQRLKDRENLELTEKLATATASNDRTKRDVQRDKEFYEGEIKKLKENWEKEIRSANNRTVWVRKLQNDVEVQKLANTKITDRMHTLTKDKDAIQVANFTLRKQVFLC